MSEPQSKHTRGLSALLILVPSGFKTFLGALVTQFDIIKAMARKPFIDDSILRAALVGLEQKKSELDAQIAEIRQQLDGTSATKTAPVGGPTKKKRVLSPAARRRIAEATRRRWAAYRKAKAHVR